MTTLEYFWKDFKKKQKTFEIASKAVKTHYLIADKDMTVMNGDVYEIPVKKHKLLQRFTPHLSGYTIHPLGITIGIGEKMPKPIDLERNIDHAVFIAKKNGAVKKGDLIGEYVAITLKSLS